MRAISSCSEKASVAVDMATGGRVPIVMKLYTRDGFKVPGRLTEFRAEREVMVPKGARYRIESAEEKIYRGERVMVVVGRQR